MLPLQPSFAGLTSLGAVQFSSPCIFGCIAAQSCFLFYLSRVPCPTKPRRQEARRVRKHSKGKTKMKNENKKLHVLWKRNVCHKMCLTASRVSASTALRELKLSSSLLQPAPYNSTRTGPQNHPHPGAPQKSWYLWDWGHSKVQKLQAVCSIHFLILPNIGSWLVGWFVSPQRTNFWAQGHLRHIHNQACFFMMWPNHKDNFVVDKIRRQHSVHLWVTSK